MKRWIIGGRARECSNDRCNRYGKKGTVELDPATGKIDVRCSACTIISEYQASSWKERRPCKACGFVRDVKVTIWHGGGGEHARDFCNACEMLNAAEVHREAAIRMKAKANAIIAARRK